MAMETDKKKKAAKKVHATFRSSMMRPQMKDKPLKAKEKEEVVEKKRRIWVPHGLGGSSASTN